MLWNNTAVGGSSANPPTIAHLELARALVRSGRFNTVKWYPCGERDDKQYGVDPSHREAMSRLLFHELTDGTQFELLMDDVYGQNTLTLTRLRALSQAFPAEQFWWFTGVDILSPREEFGGKSEVEVRWMGGAELLREWPVAVIPRVGYPHPSTLTFLHPESIVLDVVLPDCSASDLRRRIRDGEPFEHLTTASVANYIKQHGLYGFGRQTLTSVSEAS